MFLLSCDVSNVRRSTTVKKQASHPWFLFNTNINFFINKHSSHPSCSWFKFLCLQTLLWDHSLKTFIHFFLCFIVLYIKVIILFIHCSCHYLNVWNKKIYIFNRQLWFPFSLPHDLNWTYWLWKNKLPCIQQSSLSFSTFWLFCLFYFKA